MPRRSNRQPKPRRDPDFGYNDDGHNEENLWRVESVEGRRVNAETGQVELLVEWGGVNEGEERWQTNL